MQHGCLVPSPDVLEREQTMKLNDTSISLGNTALTSSKKEDQNPQFKKLTDTYQEHAKLVFLFDVSGSMEARIAKDKHGNTYINEFVWEDDVLTAIRLKVDAAIVTMMADADAMPDDPELVKLIDMNQGKPNFVTDDELKESILKANLIDHFGILPDVVTKRHQSPPTRLEVVKKLARQEIHARFAKYPNSRIAVVPFSDVAAALFDDGDQSEVDAAIDQLSVNLTIPHYDDNGQLIRETMMTGGTSILEAIHEGVEVCRRAPSMVGIHHIITVTDGGADVSELAAWVPTLKQSGVVLDYIHIGDETMNDNLVKACEALGGEAVSVNTEKDLTEKFIKATQRLMLPPATN